ncbi:hypothetical protein G6F46_013797 [Rhizopus delemar]|nr:hypothetical protein G6F46_013797 [Rhizopus delemar]
MPGADCTGVDSAAGVTMPCASSSVAVGVGNGVVSFGTLCCFGTTSTCCGSTYLGGGGSGLGSSLGISRTVVVSRGSVVMAWARGGVAARGWQSISSAAGQPLPRGRGMIVVLALSQPQQQA